MYNFLKSKLSICKWFSSIDILDQGSDTGSYEFLLYQVIEDSRVYEASTLGVQFFT
jgi:hypothetical protein